MEVPLIILACFLVGFSEANSYDHIHRGQEGDNITITCSHTFAWSNTKYFCREKCDDKDVLITSSDPNTAKYHIDNRGNTFYVTIKNLGEKDSGSYRCGVDRFYKDTYKSVYLTVDKKPKNNHNKDVMHETVSKKNQTADENNKTDEVKNKTEEARNATDSSEKMNQTLPSSESVRYIVLGLGICIGALVLVVLLFFLRRMRGLGASSADPDEKTDRRAVNSPDPEAVVYSLITAKRRVQNPADDTLYANVPPTRTPSRAAPGSEAVTYSAIRAVDADPT